MLVKDITKDRTLNFSLLFVYIDRRIFSRYQNRMILFFFSKRTIGRSSKIFGYNLAELRARDTLTMCIDIMGENVKKNAIFPPLLSFLFKLFTCPSVRVTDPPGNFEMHERV